MELHAYNYNLSSLQDVTNNSPCSDLWNWDCNTRFILYGHCFYLMWWAWRDPLMWLETQESEFLFINRAKIKKTVLHPHLFTGYYIPIYLPVITSPSIYRLLHPHLFTGYYIPIYLPVITSPSIYRLLHPHLFTGFYIPIYLPVITSPSIYRLLHPHLFTGYYTGISLSTLLIYLVLLYSVKGG